MRLLFAVFFDGEFVGGGGELQLASLALPFVSISAVLTQLAATHRDGQPGKTIMIVNRPQHTARANTGK